MPSARPWATRSTSRANRSRSSARPCFPRSGRPRVITAASASAGGWRPRTSRACSPDEEFTGLASAVLVDFRDGADAEATVDGLKADTARRPVGLGGARGATPRRPVPTSCDLPTTPSGRAGRHRELLRRTGVAGRDARPRCPHRSGLRPHRLRPGAAPGAGRGQVVGVPPPPGAGGRADPDPGDGRDRTRRRHPRRDRPGRRCCGASSPTNWASWPNRTYRRWRSWPTQAAGAVLAILLTAVPARIASRTPAALVLTQE